MSEDIKTLKRNESGFGILIESDAGYIDPKDKRNKDVIKEVFSKIGKTNPENYGKTVFPLELHVVLQKSDRENQNGRVYPRAILEREVEAYKELIATNTSGGECQHPDSTEISLERMTHRITSIEWNNNTVVGTILIYVTLGFLNLGIVSSLGDQIALLLSYDQKVGISSRGVGSVEKVNGLDRVQDDFSIIAWDLVASPSTPSAWVVNDKSELQQYVENKQVKKPMLENKVKNFLGLMND